MMPEEISQLATAFKYPSAGALLMVNPCPTVKKGKKSKKKKKWFAFKNKMCNIKFSNFLYFLAAFVARLVTVYIGLLVDAAPGINYTDTDYEVFSDAATHVYNGGSPYARHTYRYTPIAAYICLVNNIFHPQAGKILFCALDIIVGVLYW